MELNKRFYSRKEVALILSLSLPTIARRLADGSIPFVKLGARVLIPAEVIERLTGSAYSSRSPK